MVKKVYLHLYQCTSVIYMDGADSAVTQVLTPASGVETAADVFSFLESNPFSQLFFTLN